MTQSAAFAYAGARLLARHGRRPSSADWKRLRRLGDFGHFLQAARDTGLAPYVRHIAADADAHEVERALRQAFHGHIHEVAAWQPGPWGPAVRWLALLPELPALDHLASGQAAWPWMGRLPVVAGALADDNRLQPRGPAASLIRPGPDGAPLIDRWQRQWRALLPARPRRYRPPLRHLETAFTGHRKAVAAGDADAAARLEDTLIRTLRHHGREPAGAFAYLGLTALDLEHLRRDLLLRRLLPEQAA